jgi:hypothetical protein
VTRRSFGPLACASLAALASAYEIWGRPWHLHWGATSQEVRMRLPGDDEVRTPLLDATRAVTIDVPPEDVWPWLIQLGYRRAGWYAFDLFDNDGIPSAEEILPEFQHLDLGQVIGEEGYAVTQLDPDRTLLLTFHHPGTQWVRRRGLWPKFGDSSLCFHLVPLGNGTRTRLIVRTKFSGPLVWSPLVVVFFEPADFVSQHKMIRGIKRRAERGFDSTKVRRGEHHSAP